MLSIIIPALNEEKRLPKLLDSIAKQGLTDYEVIVADGGSTDKTLQIARKFCCKIAKGGLPPIARNNGAKLAKGNLLLFLDADDILPKYALKKALADFKKRRLDIASSQLKPIENTFPNRLILLFGNIGMVTTQIIDPHAAGPFILVKKSIHKKLNGFDETLKQAEDHDYAKRSSKMGRFRILKGIRICTSMRRFEEEGHFRLLMKYYKSELMRKLKGKIDYDIYDYKYGNFK